LGGGFVGKILKVDLTQGKIHVEAPEESFYRTWLGGYGLGSRIIYSDIVPKSEPLQPENIIGFVTGILTGSLSPLGSSISVVGKSPLTGTWGDSRVGGQIGTELKAAGFDAVFFYGQSPKPVYLWVNDGKAEIKDASRIWGKNVNETQDILREEHNDNRVHIAAIGSAGEKLSLISCIITDKGRAAGRSGLGALMGSKNLKALAVRGTGKIPLHDRDKFMELRKKFIDMAKEDREMYWEYFTKYGTLGATAMLALAGDAPVKNWSGVGSIDFPNAEKISDESVIKYFTRPYACHGCPLACGGYVKIENGPYKLEAMKPEYETLASFGTLCLNDNVESLLFINDLCNKNGLDSISTGTAVAFAIECYEKGLISKEDTGGLELAWGNADAIVKLTEMIMTREGLGNILADGVKVAAEKIGKGSEKYAMHVAGEEVPMHDPKLMPTYGSAYLFDATPGRHTQGFEIYLDTLSGVQMPPFKEDKYDFNEKGAGMAHMSYFSHVINSLGVCLFLSNLVAIQGIPNHADFVNAATGWNTTMTELLVCGERIACMRQAFNVREGFEPSDFKLPARVCGKPPLSDGPLKGITVEFENWVKEYYKYADWDYETGKPSERKLIQLGLEDVAKDLHKSL
jgi:aldehyde:ferredoxin oxidoreductase